MVVLQEADDVKLSNHFTPATWAVSEYFTEQEYLTATNLILDPVPDTFAGVRRSHPLAVPPHLMRQYVNIVGAREHEWSHYRQHISTHHGLFQLDLCAMREYAVVNYFRALNRAKQPYVPCPFVLKLRALMGRGDLTDAEKEQMAWLVTWVAADIVDGALWGKTLPLKTLMLHWSTVIKGIRLYPHYINARDTAITQGESQDAVRTDTCGLTTAFSPTSQSCPDGHVTVQALAEGFAGYRVFRHLAALYTPKTALRQFGRTQTAEYGAAWRSLEAVLGIPFYHPLAGALLEMAVLCFEHPMLTESDAGVCWEDIHPGMRFERTLEQLSNTLRAVPDTEQDSYDVALNAYGLDTDLSKRYGCLDRLMADYTPIESLRLDDHHGPQEVGRHFIYASFRAAFRLRHRYRMIFYEPWSAPSSAREEFFALTRPPVVIGPQGIFLPHGAGRDISVGLASLLGALTSAALDDLAREAETLHFAELARRAIASFPEVFQPDFPQRLLRSICGSCADNCLSAMLEE